MDLQPSPLAWALGILGVLCLGVVLARLLAWVSAMAEQRLLNEQHTVIAEYDAPKQLTPAELGYIIDARFGSNELLATIAQLYAKGAVKLQALDGGDFQITVSNDDKKRAVDDSEATVLGYLRTTVRSETTWSHLNELLGDVVGPQADLDDAVMQSLVEKGFLAEGALGTMLLRKRLLAFVVATAATAALLVPVYLWGYKGIVSAGASTSAGFMGIDRDVSVLLLVPIALLLWFCWFLYANLLAYIYLHRAGIPMGATDQLRALWPDVAGFRLFLQETEYVRLQHDGAADDPSMAYCLALGLDPGFAKTLVKP